MSFDGTYYRLKDAQIAPRSPRQHGSPIVIGGKGPKRTLPLVAQYADEWNVTSMPLDEFVARSRELDALLEERGRRPEDVKRTMMAGSVIGRDDADLARKLDGDDKARLQARGAVVGTGGEVVEILGRMGEAGIQGVQLQWLDMDDISGLEYVAAEVLPQVR